MAKNSAEIGRSSARLGIKGERTFSLLCSDASIICNRSSDEDQDGWDFFISLDPLFEPGSVGEDHPANRQCLVQVKTILPHTTNVSLRLSAADRLVRSTLPAFIVVFRAKQDGSLGDCIVQHIGKDIIEKVLRRLHEVPAIQINQVILKLPLKSLSSPILLEAPLLRAAFEAACGADLFKYSEAKGEQIRTVGYSEGRYIGKFTVTPEKASELTEFFLGQKTMDVTGFVLNDMRWGLPKPIELGEKVAKISLSQSGKKSELTIKSVKGRTVRWPADAYVSPKIASEAPKVRVSTTLFDFLFSPSQANIVSVDEKDALVSVQDWLKHAETYEILSEKTVEFILRMRSATPLSVKMNSDHDLDTGAIRQNIYFFSDLLRLARYLGRQDFLISENQMMHNGRSLQHLSRLIASDDDFALTKVPFSEAVDFRPPVGTDFDILVVKCVLVGEELLADYSTGKCQFVENEGACHLNFHSMRLRQVEFIGSNEADYAAFQRRARLETGIRDSIVLNLQRV